jgi:hypothetical protein
MPRKTREGLIPYEETDQREYHRLYYKKNRDLIKMKRMLAKETIITEDVKAWKERMLNNPYALYPFYDPSSSIRYGEESATSIPDTSNVGSPSSSPTSINSKASL